MPFFFPNNRRRQNSLKKGRQQKEKGKEGILKKPNQKKTTKPHQNKTKKRGEGKLIPKKRNLLSAMARLLQNHTLLALPLPYSRPLKVENAVQTFSEKYEGLLEVATKRRNAVLAFLLCGSDPNNASFPPLGGLAQVKREKVLTQFCSLSYFVFLIYLFFS